MSDQTTKKKPSILSSIFNWVIIGILIIYSLYFSISTIIAHSRANESLNWPSVVGVVTKKNFRRFKSSKSNNIYITEIEYRYNVDNESYISDRVNVHGTKSYRSPEEARVFLNKFPQEGQKIDVFYNPEDLAFAIVYKDKISIWRSIAIAMILWTFSLAWLYSGIKNYD